MLIFLILLTKTIKQFLIKINFLAWYGLGKNGKRKNVTKLTLKAPIFWKSSHLKCRALPDILSSVELVITGVQCTYGLILLAASWTSWKLTSTSLEAILWIIIQRSDSIEHSRKVNVATFNYVDWHWFFSTSQQLYFDWSIPPLFIISYNNNGIKHNA